jgi:hypothetical protein
MADVKDPILVAFAYILFERTFFNLYAAPTSMYT